MDVYGILGARKILALEAKKTNHTTGALAEVKDEQIAFLERLGNCPMVESYFVFDKHPDLRSLHLPTQTARSVASLAGTGAVRPEMMKHALNAFAALIGPAAVGLTLLDVIARVLLAPEPTDPNVVAVLQLLAENISQTNNCVLWFFGDGYAFGYTVDEIREALPLLTQIDQMKEGQSAVKAHTHWKAVDSDPLSTKRAKNRAKEHFQDALVTLNEAVVAHIQSRASPLSHESEMAVGDTPHAHGKPLGK